MSLGTWFRDYVYIPLGGNRCSKARNIFNLFVTWLLTGLWHGANFTFILWGLMYFVLLVIEKFYGISHKKSHVQTVLKWAYTMFFVILGWVLFRADSIGNAFVYLCSLFHLNGNVFKDVMFTGWFTQNMFLLGIGVMLSTPLFRILSEKWAKNRFVGFMKPIGLMILFTLSVASLISSSYNPFIYFNF